MTREPQHGGPKHHESANSLAEMPNAILRWNAGLRVGLGRDALDGLAVLDLRQDFTCPSDRGETLMKFSPEAVEAAADAYDAAMVERETNGVGVFDAAQCPARWTVVALQGELVA